MRAALILAALIGGLFRTQAAPPSTTGPRIVTTVFPVYCLTRMVAGETANVMNLLPNGAGPHDYQFTPQDFRLLAGADLVLLNGLGLEDWLVTPLKNLPQGRRTVVEVCSNLSDALILDSTPEGANASRNLPNPHLWLDPVLAARMATNIFEALRGIDPDGTGRYSTNLGLCVKSLHSLNEDLTRETALFKSKAVVTSHASFNYFNRRYGFQSVGTLYLDPEVPPSPRDLAQLSRAVRQKQVRVIFAELRSPSDLAIQFARDLKLPVAALDTLETGAMEVGAYERGMRANLAVLKKYLN